ncbi:hypothetical protein [Streptomyces sp. NPDC057854]|uniref:hypothetical protein n=1 Tax=unclassified Streptomyces TaxID=2593676 RepID=UPI003690FCBB
MTLTDTELDGLIKAIGLKRPRGGSSLKPIAHGTARGYKQHTYRNDPPCDECRQAELAHQRERYAIRKGRTGQHARGASQ